MVVDSFSLLLRFLIGMNSFLLRIGRNIAWIALALMVLVILLQVFCRYVLGSALAWPDEGARFLMLWMTGMIAPSAYRVGGFVAIEMLSVKLSEKFSHILMLILLLMSAVVIYHAIGFGWKHTMGFGGNFESSSLKLPLDWFGFESVRVKLRYAYASLFGCMVLLFTVNIELILRSLFKLFSPQQHFPRPGRRHSGSGGCQLMLSWFLPVFLLCLMVGLPVFFALLFSPGILLWLNGQERDMALLYRNVYNGMDSFPLMALPFFMLAGELMNRGGITIRLVEFSQALMGHLRGGLAHVNILSSMLFAGLSGSAVADTSALGSTLIPAMEKNGYSRKFAAAVTAASSVIGPIIPPSGIMIIYAYVMGESVAALFLAGIVPGIMVGAGLMIVVRLIADKYDLPKAERIINKNQSITSLEHWVSFVLIRLNIAGLLYALLGGVNALLAWQDAGQLTLSTWVTTPFFLLVAHYIAFAVRKRVSNDFRIVCKKAAAPLQAPIIILGGILVGVFTPTEASAVAVAYALLISMLVLRSMKFRDLPSILAKSAMGSATVLLLVGAAVAFKTVVSLSHAPEQLADFILSLSENPLMLLFLINMLLFIVGMFLDAGPAIIILGPILAPIFISLGVHPVHFAIIMSVNLTVGLATPPMGLVLFVASSVSGERVETISRTILPFLAVEILVIFLVTYFPAFSMTIPRITGFVQ